LKLGGVMKEPSQEEIVWEKKAPTVSKIILGLLKAELFSI